MSDELTTTPSGDEQAIVPASEPSQDQTESGVANISDAGAELDDEEPSQSMVAPGSVAAEAYVEASSEIQQDSDIDDDVAGEDAVAPEQAPERNTENMSILEAALFASTESLSPARLKTIVPGQPDARVVRKMVNTINAKLQKERHPFEIVEIGGGYQFRTVPYYHPWVQQIFKEKAARRLSIQALECLAVIAYRQPITKAEIERIRGVTSEGAMKTLLEKHLVTIAGRSDKAGHPLLYASTASFLQYFGLNKITDLPKIEEFESMARQKMDELTDEELKKIDAAGAEPAEGEQPLPADGMAPETAVSADAPVPATPEPPVGSGAVGDTPDTPSTPAA